MVVKMMSWRPWPPLVSRKYEVRLILRRMEGFDPAGRGAGKLTVEIRWKGPSQSQRAALMSSLRRVPARRNFTKEAELLGAPNGVVSWDEEFQSVCSLSPCKDNVFLPWEICFTVFNNSNKGAKNKAAPVVGTASLNLAEFASSTVEKEFEFTIPLTLSGAATEPSPSLCLYLSLLEPRASLEPTESVQRATVPMPSSPQSGETVSTEKDDLSAIKAGLRKVKILTSYVSTRRAKKTLNAEEGSEGRSSTTRSEDCEYIYPFDSDNSLDDFEEGESDGVKADSSSSFRKSFSYGTLAYANCVGGSVNASASSEDEDLVYYSNKRSDAGCSHMDDSTASVSEASAVPLTSSKLSILSWKKRKLSFRSPKARGEPLLKKAYAEEGGDDIDFDRRQLSSDEDLSLGWAKADDGSSANRSSISEFGEDSFAVGSWERKEVTNRDGHLRLESQVFFASIDQRSERAAGESACTALVAVIADWFQNNPGLMPVRSQFDGLIREGSLEWRNLCESETYMEKFPDKHFDLETVLQAKIRQLTVVPGRSFIGFFHPEGMDEGRFDFLHGAMSFDSIWDEIEITRSKSDGEEPQVYVVSWNDHFFVLKVEREAYYIVDTLGERLYEGCDQAYILKFDRDTVIYKQADDGKESDASEKSEREEDVVVCRGKESCKEYVKSFLAAIPIRELQADIKKGPIASTLLHQRLQIEVHYTQFLPSPPSEAPGLEVTVEAEQQCKLL